MTLPVYEYLGTSITRRELYGTRLELILWTGLVLGSPLFALFGLAKYPPLVTDPKDLLFVALGLFVVAAPLIFALRKKLMPWGEKAPVIMWLTVLCLPIVPIMAGQGFFLVANGTLDRSRPAEMRTVIVRVNHGKGVTLRSAADSTTRVLFDITQTDHDNVERGDSVQLRVKPGALGLPWISAYTLRRIPAVTPALSSRTSAAFHKLKR